MRDRIAVTFLNEFHTSDTNGRIAIKKMVIWSDRCTEKCTRTRRRSGTSTTGMQKTEEVDRIRATSRIVSA